MAIDTSIYDQANKPSVQLQDPMQQLGQIANAQNAVNQNRLFQQQNAAQMAIGRAVQQATGPDGVVDTGKVNRLVSQNPDASFGAQGAATTQQDLQNAQTLGSTGQMQQHIALRGQVNNVMGSLLAKEQITQSDVVGAVGDLVNQGVIPARMIGPILANAPLSDPTALRGWAENLQRQNMNTMQQYGQAYGTRVAHQTGNGTIYTTVNPENRGGGLASNGSFVPTQLSPAELASQQTGTDAQGRNTATTLADRLATQGRGGMAAGGPPAIQQLGQGRYPTLPQRLLNPNRTPDAVPGPMNAVGSGLAPTTTPMEPAPAQSPAVDAAPAPAQGQPVVTGIGPAKQAALTETGSSSGKAFGDITDQGLQARGQVATLGNMLADASQFTSGMTKVNDVRSFVTKQAPAIARAFGLDTNAVSAQQSFDKLANQIASAQGAGTDARLAIAEHANPNSTLTPDVVDSMLRQLQGNADYNQARATLAAQYPDKADRTGFEASVANNLDPRAFQAYRLTPTQRQRYAESLSRQDKDKVEAAWDYAKSKGIFPSASVSANGQ